MAHNRFLGVVPNGQRWYNLPMVLHTPFWEGRREKMAANHGRRKPTRFFVVLFSLFLAASLPAQKSGEAAKPSFKLAVIPETVRRGDPFVVALAGPGGKNQTLEAVLISPRNNELGKARFFPLNEQSTLGPVQTAILAVPTTSASGNALIRVLENGKVLGEVNFTIELREFRSETLILTTAMSDILTKPDPQKTLEAEKLWAILSHTGTEVFTQGNFVMPVNSQVQTSRFGTRRANKYPDGRTGGTAIHAGIDYRAPEGTAITVCAPGRVVFAGPRIVTGNTVVIEHMPGVYSLCYHLSKISLKEGTMAAAGDPLGEAGSTGFSTASHLHWEVRVAGENTDPEAFFNRIVLDKNAILSKLNEQAVPDQQIQTQRR